jgi:acyl carrier protein
MVNGIHDVDNIISDVFEIEVSDIEYSMTPDDIEKWDSLGNLILINTIEFEFKITLELEEIFSIEKIEDIYELLRKRGSI